MLMFILQLETGFTAFQKYAVQLLLLLWISPGMRHVCVTNGTVTWHRHAKVQMHLQIQVGV